MRSLININYKLLSKGCCGEREKAVNDKIGQTEAVISFDIFDQFHKLLQHTLIY